MNISILLYPTPYNIKKGDKKSQNVQEVWIIQGFKHHEIKFKNQQ